MHFTKKGNQFFVGGEMGCIGEDHFVKEKFRYLPNRYRTSDQIGPQLVPFKAS